MMKSKVDKDKITASIIVATEDMIDRQPISSIVYCEETKGVYKFNTHIKEWERQDFSEKKVDTKISLYDVNRQLVKQAKTMSEYELKEKVSELENFHERFNNSHYMLLCKELSYYTLFEKDYLDETTENFGTSIIEIIGDLGEVKGLYLTKDCSAYEIWIKIKDSDEDPHVFYLFPYDRGVVYYAI